MTYIGLDLGSTYTKIAFMNRSVVLKQQRLPTPARLSSASERYEIDAEQYFQQILTLLDEYAQDGADGLLLSTQMHGYVLTDAAFHPISPYVSWQDLVGAKHLDALGRAMDSDSVSPSGVPLKANLALCSLWGRMQEGLSLSPGTRLCTLGGYVIGRLTGRHICHMTNAAPTGLADVRNGSWNLCLKRRAGLDALELPEISTDIRAVGQWRDVPVYPDFGDQQVCALGAELTPDHALHVSMGTAGLIGVLTDEWGRGAYENRPWFCSGRYLRTVSGLPGGRDVAALKDEVLHSFPHALSQEEAWRFMTTLDASRLPGQADALAERITAFYREMAAAYCLAADRMERRITRLAFSGGCAAKNPILREHMAAAFSHAAYSGRDHDVMLGFQSMITQLEESI